MAVSHANARIPLLDPRSLIALVFIATGCARTVSATFPGAYPPPAVHQAAIKVGLAPVADSRSDESAGWPNSNVTIFAGPAFPEYVEHKFRGQLVEEGYAPIDVKDPTDTDNTGAAGAKTILVTVQSTDVGGTGTIMPHAIASTDIAVQVFAPASHTIVFAQSYKGIHRENGKAGELLAAAADWAIDEAFADKAFLAALR